MHPPEVGGDLRHCHRVVGGVEPDSAWNKGIDLMGMTSEREFWEKLDNLISEFEGRQITNSAMIGAMWLQILNLSDEGKGAEVDDEDGEEWKSL